MRISRTLTCIALLSFALGLAACKGNCQQLSEKLCDCLETTFDKQACQQQVSIRQDRISPNADQERVCKSLLASCDCHSISTLEGKRACGLAR